jgi:xanthine/CO dehydrogenase XdhC/CoxF family maturation factor
MNGTQGNQAGLVTISTAARYTARHTGAWMTIRTDSGRPALLSAGCGERMVF